MGTVPYEPHIDAHVAFAAWLGTDPDVVRTRSAAAGVLGAAAGSNVDVATVLEFINLDVGRTAAQTVEGFASGGLIRRLYEENANLTTGSGPPVDPALVANHAAARDPLVALRGLLLHGSGMQKLSVTKIDALGTAAGAFGPTGLALQDIYERMFFRRSHASLTSGGAINVSLAEWCQMTLHPGYPTTFTGRILCLKQPVSTSAQLPEGVDLANLPDYWRFHCLHPSAPVTDADPSLINDVIKMTILTRAEKLADPERLKSSSVDANQLDREDQMRATAELLAAHAVAIGLLRYIVTDCYFEALLQTPWLKPLVAAALERVSLTEVFNRASAVTAPYRVCNGPLTELWSRLKPINATIDTIMDKAHPIYGVPSALWRELMTNAYPSVPRSAGATAFADVGGVFVMKPSRRGTGMRSYRIMETALISPLGTTPGATHLDQFVENRLALADMLSGATETRVAQALRFILAQLGWTSAPTSTRTLAPSLFGTPVLTDGSYIDAAVDIVDQRAGRCLLAADAVSTTTIITAGAQIYKSCGYAVGSPVGRPTAMKDLGMPSAEEPRDYAGLTAAPTYAVDFDTDARIVPNTVDEWSRQMGITAGEFTTLLQRHPDKWIHLFTITAAGVTPLPDVNLAITSSRVARLARSTIIVGLPGGTTMPTGAHFAENEADLQYQLGRTEAYDGDFGVEWSPTRAAATGSHGAVTGSVPRSAPGPLPIVYLDSVDPAIVRCLATWQPPTVVADGALPTGTRHDSLTTNEALTRSY